MTSDSPYWYQYILLSKQINARRQVGTSPVSKTGTFMGFKCVLNEKVIPKHIDRLILQFLKVVAPSEDYSLNLLLGQFIG